MDNHGKVRRIASEWHGGQNTCLYAFVSTGTILPNLLAEIEADMLTLDVNVHDEFVADELSELRDYVAETGERGPVPNWDDLWEGR